jgi:hypothetical protein
MTPREIAEQLARGETCGGPPLCLVTGPLCEDCSELADRIEAALLSVQDAERQRIRDKVNRLRFDEFDIAVVSRSTLLALLAPPAGPEGPQATGEDRVRNCTFCGTPIPASRAAVGLCATHEARAYIIPAAPPAPDCKLGTPGIRRTAEPSSPLPPKKETHDI